jgi:hypothetical protein
MTLSTLLRSAARWTVWLVGGFGFVLLAGLWPGLEQSAAATAGTAAAGAVDGPAATPAPAAVNPPVMVMACAPGVATVVDAYREVEAADPSTTSGLPRMVVKKAYDVELGNVLTVEATGLAPVLAELASPACAGKSLVLYLDDRPLPDLVAFPPTDPGAQRLRFTLARTEKSRDAWAFLLGSPRWEARAMKVSVGLADGFAFPSTARAVDLTVIPHIRFVFWAVLLALMLVAFAVLAAQSDLLRDGDPPPGGARRPFSLARSQAAWWFFLILASYLFIGLITGDFSTSITGTVLVLLGISAGTVVGSAVVDASKATPADQANRAQVIAQLTSQVSAGAALVADPQAAPSAALQADLERKKEQLKVARNESDSFLLDILSDANGVSFPRFQVAAWTVVLGIVFVSAVYRGLAMPTFDGSLLSLMGISSGTYLGMKVPEARIPTVT